VPQDATRLQGAKVTFAEALSKIASETGASRRAARAAMIAQGWTPDGQRP
jgi:hypothetical protein